MKRDPITTPIETLGIAELIFDEFLRLGVRPDWHPGAAELPRHMTRHQKPKPPRTFAGDDTLKYALDMTAPARSIRLGDNNV